MNKSSEKSTPTANDLLSATQTVSLLEQLRAAVRDISNRVDEHERDFNSRAVKLQAQFDLAIKTEREQTAAALESENAAFASLQAQLKSFFDARRKRIAEAYQNARTKRLKQIDDAEAQHTLNVQRGLIEAEHKRDADIAAAKTSLENFIARLNEELAALQHAEARARSTLGPFRSLAKLLKHLPETKLDLSAPEEQLADKLHDAIVSANRALSRCQAFVLPLLFRILPIWILLPLALLLPFAFVPALRSFDFANVPQNIWAIVGGSVVGIVVLFVLARILAASPGRAAAIALEQARRLYDACAAKAQTTHTANTERAHQEFTAETQRLNASWKQNQADSRDLRKDAAAQLEEQSRKLRAIADDREYRRQSKLKADHEKQIEDAQSASAARLNELKTAHDDNVVKLDATRDAAREALDAEWRDRVVPLFERLQYARAAAEEQFPAWRGELWQDFDLPDAFVRAARFGELEINWQTFFGVNLEGKRLALPGENEFPLPLLLSVPDSASVLFETKNSGHEQIIGTLNNAILRLLTSAPPGKVAFTIFDPVGLGQNFAGIMHLADFEERVINSRIWTQQAQFEQRLADLSEHIEKVTQMYLRNEYATLAEYNEQAGRLAEKYQFLVIADFPVNFSDVAVKRLQNIIASGPRCGVHTLIHWDQRRQAPLELVPDELRKNNFIIVPRGDGFAIAGTNWEGVKLVLDSPPDAELATELLHKIGKASTDSYRVEMPFSEVVPGEGEFWSLDTTKELRVPIGRTGATKLQYLALGQGTRQHGLVAGKTGSGKSTLFHVIITNLSLWCSPDQVEFYLVDFKKGVEFKTYATHKLPHARVIAIESDREFGLSVLQRVDDELKRRGDLFRKLGAQDIAGYKRAVSGTGVSPVSAGSDSPVESSSPHGQDARATIEPMPRVLLLIDEFQELFVEDDRVSQNASLLLDRIVRQGRAFGIHVLLGSQTLGGAYTLARATIGQMVVRIALQCNETDAYLIMSEDNPAPRLLSRPGEAIYNDEGGAIQGNSPFQIVWLPDQTRDEWLDKAEAVAEERKVSREPIVFEGNAPADVKDNPVLRSLLNAPAITPTKSPRIFLGAPNSIKGPTEAVFHRQSGNHLLVVGQREEAALAMLVTAQISLAAQHAKDAAKIFVFDCSPPDSAEARVLQRVAQTIHDGVRIVSAGETPDVISEITAELDRRTENPGDAPAIFLLVHGLQQNKKLRFDEEASFSLDASATATNPGLAFNKLITEGAAQGIHVIATCDSYNNVMRMLSRKALSEFEMRVVFQMSANDSASLIESPAANNLGLHRAILHNGQQGWMETFRPYALPDEAWLAEAGEKLRRIRMDSRQDKT